MDFEEDDVYEGDEELEQVPKTAATSTTVRKRTKRKETAPGKSKKSKQNNSIKPISSGEAENVNNPMPEDYFEISFNDDSNAIRESDLDMPLKLALYQNLNIKESFQRRQERALRAATRHVHFACLLIALSFHSRSISSPIRRADMLSKVPPHLLRQFAPDILEDGRTVLNALSMLSNWWKNTNRDSAENEFELASSFVTIVRALGLKSRLVCSIQPLRIDGGANVVESSATSSPTATKSGKSKIVKAISSSSTFDSKIISVTSTSNLSKSPSKVTTSPPIFWCEVYHQRERRWIPVDCIRAVVNDRLAMEPPLISSSSRQHLFIIGFDSVGRAIDVTRRYSSRYFSMTAKGRRSDEKILSELLSLLKGRLSQLEEAELASLVDGEPLPTTASGFQGHGRYMLNKQLKKYEIFWPPDAGIIGDFRGQPIRLRSVVQKVRSKEAWYTQFGRIIKEGEEPCKQVTLPALPVRKKANDNTLPSLPPERAAPRLQPLYGEWQTEPYSPPIAVDGQVPRNKFGSVDLYLPSMLPVGCVWIDDACAYMAARDLGVDYATACVRFAFTGRSAVPDLRGIVICAEFEGAVRRRLAEIKIELVETLAEREEVEREKKARLEKRRKRIKEKIEREHGIDMDGEQDQDDNRPDHIVSTLAKPGILDEDNDDLDFF
jgi:xeroderma pigmentosum group C-complementing protein